MVARPIPAILHLWPVTRASAANGYGWVRSCAVGFSRVICFTVTDACVHVAFSPYVCECDSLCYNYHTHSMLGRARLSSTCQWVNFVDILLKNSFQICYTFFFFNCVTVWLFYSSFYSRRGKEIILLRRLLSLLLSAFILHVICLGYCIEASLVRVLWDIGFEIWHSIRATMNGEWCSAAVGCHCRVTFSLRGLGRFLVSDASYVTCMGTLALLT